jgi:hypothetical protein
VRGGATRPSLGTKQRVCHRCSMRAGRECEGRAWIGREGDWKRAAFTGLDFNVAPCDSTTVFHLAS